MNKKDIRKNIEDCIIGKKDLTKRVDNFEVCSYHPNEFPEDVLCRNAEAMYTCDKGTYYVCRKNALIAYRKTKDLNNSFSKNE